MTMTKKFILAIFAIFILLIILGFFTLYANKKKGPAPAIDTPPQEEEPTTQLENKIVIKTSRGDVAVNDIAKNPEYKIGANLSLKTTGDYQIVYSEENQNFVISITGQDPEKSRLEAERELVNLLGVDEEKLCWLNVTLGVSPAVNKNLAGKNYGLSFCPGSALFTK